MNHQSILKDKYPFSHKKSTMVAFFEKLVKIWLCDDSLNTEVRAVLWKAQKDCICSNRNPVDFSTTTQAPD
jgi:hypothetical protein